MPTSVPNGDTELDMEELMEATSSESEDEMEMEDSDEDAMEESENEECPEAIPVDQVTRLAEVPKKKSVRFVAQDILTTEERELNPQVGLNRKRMLKQMKRQERRQKQRLDADGDVEGMAEDDDDVVVDNRHGGVLYDVLRDA